MARRPARRGSLAGGSGQAFVPRSFSGKQGAVRMYTFLSVIHILICLFLVLVILLQQGRGGGLGMSFGGGQAQQVFGGQGAGNVLTRATGVAATLFMLMSVGLAYLSSSKDKDLQEQLKKQQAAQQQSKPAEKGPVVAPAPTPSGSAPSK